MNQFKIALVVDDEDQLLRLMVRLLERAGYQTWPAGDSVEALRVFREHSDEINLALIDVFHPPGAGAADLLPEILAVNPNLDVILTSGDALSESLEGTLESIGGRFLRKPFVPKALLRMLEECEATDAVTDATTAATTTTTAVTSTTTTPTTPTSITSAEVSPDRRGSD